MIIKEKIRGTTFDIMDALRAPLLTHSHSWSDAIPQRVKDIVVQARMVALTKGEDMATIPETVAFVMTRTFDGPMDHDWSEIYLYISKQMMDEYFGGDKVDWSDMHILPSLSNYQTGLLNDLRRWIYRKRREALKQVLRQPQAVRIEIVEVQCELFNVNK
jgi:hypothetical protein